MRGMLLSLVCAAGLLVAAPAKSSASFLPVLPGPAHVAITAPAPVPVFAVMQADKKIDINISTNNGGWRWYRNPVWIAIMAIGGVVLLMLIVMAARGGSGGTTVVK